MPDEAARLSNAPPEPIRARVMIVVPADAPAPFGASRRTQELSVSLGDTVSFSVTTNNHNTLKHASICLHISDTGGHVAYA